MKKLLSVSAVTVACAFSSPALAEKGVVVAICGGNYLVNTSGDYSLLEWFGGTEPSKGHTVGGEIRRLGMHDIYNLTNGSEIRVWVDDWGLSTEQAVEKWRKKCQ